MSDNRNSVLSDPDSGGLIAVCAGLVALAVIAIVAIVVVRNDTTSVAGIATGAGGVIGSIVGAFFGVKAGSRNAATALKAQQTESARAQLFAAHLDPGKADELVQKAGLEDASKPA